MAKPLEVGRNIEARPCRKCGTEISCGVYCDECLNEAPQAKKP